MKGEQDPIRVVIVDDSPTVRQLVGAILEQAGGFQVVGTGSTGEDALCLAQRLHPDVVTMDVRMPRMDGLEATRRIMREAPTPIVIITGTLMAAEVDITFEALKAGALTVVRTPGLSDPEGCQKVAQAVRLMAGVSVVHHWNAADPAPGLPLIDKSARRHTVTLIGMAGSTGGPAALAAVLSQLPADFPAPILMVQHIAPGFLSGLADWLDGEIPLQVGIANHGDTPRPGTVLLAPDGYHLQVDTMGVIELTGEPPYKGLRPSANYLFRSIAAAYGPRGAGVILTGMGDDGVEGLGALRRAGGLTLAQDEQSCVVYGMPREALAARAVDRVLSPQQIGLTLKHICVEDPLEGNYE